ncbi:ABC transporter ATP-binding protein [Tardiphaga sp.]|uniref:ABC transporter ATP-binding protein n=1 Tax=Tardiphaga sp. TaxID=1926292 RepID=UPI00262F15E8|nr:ABC transporter ATP-binding protein [Tardiphaga sp.]MDB5620730.1 Oligopeptide/dipeptide transporter, ATP-binding protein [Tardiphaga sp.]
MTAPILDIRGLTTAFSTRNGDVKPVDGISLTVERGKTLGIVGESGSGKSMLSLSIMGLVPPSGKITGGQVLLEGTDLTKLSRGAIRDVRGNRIAMIFQEPMTSLNPVYTVGFQIMEALRAHRKLTPREARAEAIEALHKVRMPAPEQRFDEYPHQLSGGMRQRVMIAMALACRPALLIADEPTTALDVTTQAEILTLLRDLRQRLGMAMLLISHDLGVVWEECERVYVMFRSRIVESGATQEVFSHPQHAYTAGLIKAAKAARNSEGRFETIEGEFSTSAD